MLEPQVFRTKPAVSRELLAMQWDGSEESQAAIVTWGGGRIVGLFDTAYFLEIHGPGVKLRVDPGDWVVEIGSGSFVPCKADQFAESYEPLTATQPKDTHLSGDGERLEEAAESLQYAADYAREAALPGNAQRWERHVSFLRDLATRLSPEKACVAVTHDESDCKHLPVADRCKNCAEGEQ